ncbi:MAG: methyl-accepting chemotaxis protein [Bryobacterales bacterium]|nr:methyl-accepting chemotaxis protein [Bryobacterales bacterium]
MVAAEVKELARKTTSATEEISTEIARMHDATGGVTKALQTICDQIADIDQIAGAIAGSVGEQRESAEAISANMTQAAQGTKELARTVQSVSSVAAETRDCASQLLQAADELSRQSSTCGRTCRACYPGCSRRGRSGGRLVDDAVVDHARAE